MTEQIPAQQYPPIRCSFASDDREKANLREGSMRDKQQLLLMECT